jgi:ubiquinone/menaquinone biosynthesis C-methylase UbiE
MGCRGPIDVLEFGCGYGNFTVAAANLVGGTVFANDIERVMVDRTIQRTNEQQLTNVVAEVLDFSVDGSGRPDESIDFVMLFNILHIDHPQPLLLEAFRVLRPMGKLGLVHWKWDSNTPRGPSMEIRPKPEQCRLWAENVGFVFDQFHEFACCKWHWGMVLHKPVN